jgi:hypothetical protein
MKAGGSLLKCLDPSNVTSQFSSVQSFYAPDLQKFTFVLLRIFLTLKFYVEVCQNRNLRNVSIDRRLKIFTSLFVLLLEFLRLRNPNLDFVPSFVNSRKLEISSVNSYNSNPLKMRYNTTHFTPYYASKRKFLI